MSSEFFFSYWDQIFCIKFTKGVSMGIISLLVVIILVIVIIRLV
jgi:hypothetical protein